MNWILSVYFIQSLANYLYKIMHINLCNRLLVICVKKSCNYMHFSTLKQLHEITHFGSNSLPDIEGSCGKTFHYFEVEFCYPTLVQLLFFRSPLLWPVGAFIFRFKVSLIDLSPTEVDVELQFYQAHGPRSSSWYVDYKMVCPQHHG